MSCFNKQLQETQKSLSVFLSSLKTDNKHLINKCRPLNTNLVEISGPYQAHLLSKLWPSIQSVTFLFYIFYFILFYFIIFLFFCLNTFCFSQSLINKKPVHTNDLKCHLIHLNPNILSISVELNAQCRSRCGYQETGTEDKVVSGLLGRQSLHTWSSRSSSVSKCAPCRTLRVMG